MTGRSRRSDYDCHHTILYNNHRSHNNYYSTVQITCSDYRHWLIVTSYFLALTLNVL